MHFCTCYLGLWFSKNRFVTLQVLHLSAPVLPERNYLSMWKVHRRGGGNMAVIIASEGRKEGRKKNNIDIRQSWRQDWPNHGGIKSCSHFYLSGYITHGNDIESYCISIYGVQVMAFALGGKVSFELITLSSLCGQQKGCWRLVKIIRSTKRV